MFFSIDNGAKYACFQMTGTIWINDGLGMIYKYIQQHTLNTNIILYIFYNTSEMHINNRHTHLSCQVLRLNYFERDFRLFMSIAFGVSVTYNSHHRM